MRLYLAPMEGVTGYVYRNAQHRYFDHIDKYFTPFISPTHTRKLTARELNDILPEHNEGLCVVPQILTNQAEGFLWMAEKLKALGYREINLNLGCPSGTVVSKGRGAGFLADPWKLDQFLAEVTAGVKAMDMQMSVKTRIGCQSPEEFDELLEVFNRYDLTELIVHPRVRTDYYQNHPNLEAFAKAAERSRNPVCYNGDIFTPEDFHAFTERFPGIGAVMMGRGVIANPALAEQIRTGGPLEKARIREFHDALLERYRQQIPGDRNVLFKMKELWHYMGGLFADSRKQEKKIRKAGRMDEYRAAVAEIFDSRPFAGRPGYRSEDENNNGGDSHD